MIDLHCHILPGIDDGAKDIDISLAMARAAVADGITVTACTPHIMQGVYNNDGEIIRSAIATLQQQLDDEGIALKLVPGADVHMDVNIVEGLKSGRIPSLNGSRYFLFEPPHHVPPPRIDNNVFSLMSSGYVPILTHPERLSWIETHYQVIQSLAGMGVVMQITAGSVAGLFGRRIRYWADKMLDEQLVDILATDAHNLTSRPPVLSKARDIVAEKFGAEEADLMVTGRTLAILENRALPRRTREASGGGDRRRSSSGGRGFLARLGFGSRH